jgi:hypothetical protein
MTRLLIHLNVPARASSSSSSSSSSFARGRVDAIIGRGRHHHHHHHHHSRRHRARAFGDAGPGAFFRNDKTEINRLEYVVETERRHAREHAEARRVAENALGEVESSRDMYKRRLEASEREAFALEKALEEKTRGVETAMAIARRQIAYQEERYEALVKEYEALKARSGET